MVSDDSNRVCGPLKILVSFLQCQDYCKEFMVIKVVVSLGEGEGMGVIHTGM